MVKRLTDGQILRQIPAARRRTQVLQAQPWWPRAVAFDAENDAVRLKLRSGVEWIVPRKTIPELKGATGNQLQHVVIAGEAIRWDDLDLDVSIPGIAVETLGPAFFAKVTGRIRGSVKTKAKSGAARVNGAKGGRPPKARTTK
jgi:hypothetical protein